ncbi:MAG: hypothetical protein JO287_02680 [Pseudonocardiales bacterium]|nr:hypothetical protein [Pseudonocardiales bacterium]
MWPVRLADWSPDPLLVDFLNAGPPPVYFSLGSFVAGDPERVVRAVVAALPTAGVRGVIQAGCSGLMAHGDDVLTTGYVPHDWLFPRMAAVAHHAGAGTTAAGLRAGIPAIPLPGAVDQPFWASRLAALGVSPGAVPLHRLTAGRLAAAVRRAVDHTAYRQRARQVADRIADEDGAGHIVAAVHQLASGGRHRSP